MNVILTASAASAGGSWVVCNIFIKYEKVLYSKE